MSTLEEAVKEALKDTIRAEVNRQLEEKLPEIIRALGITDVSDDSANFVGAEEVARILGYDTSTPEKTRQSVNKVYTLANRNLIPSVRISPRRVRFNPVKVREVLERGGNAEPFSRSA